MDVQTAHLHPREGLRTVADLSEDRLTAWAPDVAGDADLPYLAEHPVAATAPEVMRLDVPTPGGGKMRVPVLHPALLVALHDATYELRAQADSILSPGVLGYRYGACADWHYAPAWRAFSDEVARLSSSHCWVAFTDVSSFFASVSWDRVVAAADELGGTERGVELAGIAERFNAAGQDTLPSGFADARFLSNLLLVHADEQVGVPFVRWVDDYRLFADSEQQACAAVERTHTAMRHVGLEPNDSKTSIVPGGEAAERHENTLASVYHPERDPREVVHANLNRVLARAIENPVERRRDLRFALSRLGRTQDSSAVNWALAALSEIPWEAPRLVSYLAVSAADPAERGTIQDGIERALRAAAVEGDAWLIARLVPLAWQGKIEERTAGNLVDALKHIHGTPAWGLALRLLARAGYERIVRASASPDASDHRGLLAALSELGCEPPLWLSEAEPCLARALRDGPLPAPATASLL